MAQIHGVQGKNFTWQKAKTLCDKAEILGAFEYNDGWLEVADPVLMDESLQIDGDLSINSTVYLPECEITDLNTSFDADTTAVRAYRVHGGVIVAFQGKLIANIAANSVLFKITGLNATNNFLGVIGQGSAGYGGLVAVDSDSPNVISLSRLDYPGWTDNVCFSMFVPENIA